jgi:hypothetical protein
MHFFDLLSYTLKVVAHGAPSSMFFITTLMVARTTPLG